MTKFFIALFQDCDMTGALAAVRDAADVIRADFFLGHMAARVRGGGNVEAVVSDFQQAALRIGAYDGRGVAWRAGRVSRGVACVCAWRVRAGGVCVCGVPPLPPPPSLSLSPPPSLSLSLPPSSLPPA